jgi:hypothetical protein
MKKFFFVFWFGAFLLLQAMQAVHGNQAVAETYKAIVKVQKRFEHVHDINLPMTGARERVSELFKMAEYNLSDAELDQACNFMREYGIQRVLTNLDQNEITVMRSRYLGFSDKNILQLAATAREGGALDLDNFVTDLVLEKFGIGVAEAKTKTLPAPVDLPVVPPDLARAESQLRRAWNLLPIRKQELLRDEQQQFAERLDAASDQKKLRMITERTIYLLSR